MYFGAISNLPESVMNNASSFHTGENRWFETEITTSRTVNLLQKKQTNSVFFSVAQSVNKKTLIKEKKRMDR